MGKHHKHVSKIKARHEVYVHEDVFDKIDKVGSIYCTSDYSLFHKIEGNREVKPRPNLESDIVKNGMYSPVVVDPTLGIIDGQHRLEICQKHNIPVTFIFNTAGSVFSIPSLNSNQKSWTLAEYAHYYASSDTENADSYKLLDDMSQEYGISTIVTAQALSGKTHGSVHYVSKAIKDGSFEVTDVLRAESILSTLKSISSQGIRMSLNLSQALESLLIADVLDLNRFNDKVLSSPTAVRSLNKHHTLLDYLELILSYYNKSLQPTSGLFIKHYYDSKGRIVIEGVN